MPKKWEQIKYIKCKDRVPRKRADQKRIYAKFKPGDLVELKYLKTLDHNGKRAVVVGPIIKGRRFNGKDDRYPVKILGHEEPDRVFNVRHYNMLLKEIKTRRFRKFKEKEQLFQSIDAEGKVTTKKAAELQAKQESQGTVETGAVKNNSGEAGSGTDKDVAGKDVEMAVAGKEVESAKASSEEKASDDKWANIPDWVKERRKKKGWVDWDEEPKVDPILPPKRAIVGTVVEVEGEDPKHIGMTRRSRKRKRGCDKDGDESDDPEDTRPRKKFQLTFARILSGIYTTFTQTDLVRLSRFTMECRDCKVNYPVAWGEKEPRYFNWRIRNERRGPRSCMVCQTRKMGGKGLAYLLFVRMCKIDPKWIPHQKDFLEQELYWNIPMLTDAFEKVWKEVLAQDL